MKMKFTFVLKILIILFFNIFSQSNSFSQLVFFNLNQPKPGGLNIADLWSFTLTNNTNRNLVVYLEGQATEVDKNLLIASGKTVSFSLNARETKHMKVSDLPRTPEVTYHAKDPKYKESLIRTGKFPPGVYEICAQVISADTIQELGNSCLPPQIVQETGIFSLSSPEDKGEIESEKLLIFNWTPLQKAKNYSLKIVEILSGQSPEDAIKKNRIFFVKDAIRTTSFKYPVTEQKFDSSKKYAWQVMAKGDVGNEVNVISEVWSFMIKKSPPIKDPIVSPRSTIKLKTYYELTDEPKIEFVEVNNDTLNIQFINNYISSEKITFKIFDESQTVINRDNQLNQVLKNGLNRIPIYLKKFNLQPNKLYQLQISNYNNNYYLYFKTKRRI